MTVRVAIVGSSGFISSHFVRLLLARGALVYGYGLHKPLIKHDRFHWARVDVRTEAIPFPSQLDAVYYLAQSANYREFALHADDVISVNVLGAVRAASAAQESGARWYFHASSGNVYQHSFAPLAEECRLRRNDGYSFSKVAAEEAVDLAVHSIGVTALRIFGAFGPSQKSMLVPTIIHRVANNRPITLAGRLNEYCDEGLRISLCYVCDLAEILYRLLRSSQDGVPLPARLNVAGPEAISIRRLADSCGDLIGQQPVYVKSEEPREFDLVADIGRLQSLVSMRFTPIERALQATIFADEQFHVLGAA